MTETPQEYDPSNKKPTTPTEPTIIRIVVCPRLQMLYIDTLNEWGAVNSEKDHQSHSGRPGNITTAAEHFGHGTTSSGPSTR